MEDGWAWLVREAVGFGGRWVVLGALSMVAVLLGTIIFGRGYKRRIAALETKISSLRDGPTILNVNVQGARPDLTEMRKAVRAEFEATASGQLASPKETVRQLPQKPLGDGHSYAELPDGTNVVTMADGSIRFAIPKDLSDSIDAGTPTVSVQLADPAAPVRGVTEEAAFRKAETRWLHQPGVGKEAARLIMMAPTFEEAQAVHDTFLIQEPRLDASWAHYCFLYRMEMDGRSDLVMARAAEITEETGDDVIIDTEDEVWEELKSLHISTRNDR